MQPFVSGEKVTMSPPYALATLAGHVGLSDLGAAEGDAAAAAVARKAAELLWTTLRPTRS